MSPSPPAEHELAWAPELAVLHALEGLLHLAAAALRNAHPALRLDPFRFDEHDSHRSHEAVVVLAIAAALRRQLAEYRHVTDQERRHRDVCTCDDIPF